jgi:glycosyltransferase involved in cell wall biosynthesis
VKLHTVFITYNRLELTKVAISSYLETVSVPFTFVVVDNNSTDGTREWLLEQKFDISLLDENRYPGFACNGGWARAPDDADFLHRADNDFSFLPGWCEHVQQIFKTKKIGQVGLRTDEQEPGASWNVGGNCVIRRALWDKGLRYDERPWPEFPSGYSEDSFFSPAVKALGYRWTRVGKLCIVNNASGDWSDSYYQKSYGIRGITPHPDDPTVPEGFVPFVS